MSDQPITHPIPFSQMSIQEQYDLVQTSFSEALREVATVPDEATRKVLRDRLGVSLAVRPDWQFDTALGERSLLGLLQAASLQAWRARPAPSAGRRWRAPARVLFRPL